LISSGTIESSISVLFVSVFCRCSEERLIACGWNDTACFYGDSDAFMTTPTNTRERNLIKLCESVGRGRLSSISDNLASVIDQEVESDDIFDDMSMWAPADSGRSDEDFFLPQPIPPSLQTLPSLLLAARKNPCNTSKINHEVLARRQVASSKAMLDMVESVCSLEAGARMFCLGIQRFCDSPLQVEFDSKIFLDYGPMLRTIAQLEAVLERAIATCPDLSTVPISSRRRTRGRGESRQHYFETLTHSAFYLNQKELTASAVGCRLAGRLIRYKHEH
jgi:hypothetical protein